MRHAAYLFDVQGTLLDFFVPVRDAISKYLGSLGEESRDAGELTRQWRANYFRRVAALRQSADSWTRTFAPTMTTASSAISAPNIE